MDNQMDDAVEELITIYTDQALSAYQEGDLSEAARCAQRILAYDPEDVNALFLKGATIGRSSKPGEMHIRQAFDVWKPLMKRVTGQERADLYDAIRYAFSMMTETCVTLGFRFWSSYCSTETICSLRDVLQELTDLEQSLPEDEEERAWILPMFEENYSKWVYDIVGADLQVPTGSNQPMLDAFREMLQLLSAFADKINIRDRGDELLLKRTRQAVSNFEKINR